MYAGLMIGQKSIKKAFFELRLRRDMSISGEDPLHFGGTINDEATVNFVSFQIEDFYSVWTKVNLTEIFDLLGW